MTLRELLVDWLTASRYVKWLEMRHTEQRQDFTLRLAEKDEQIKILRTEVASLKLECDKMRTVLMLPRAESMEASRPPVLPAFSGPDDWQAELNRLYEQENLDGIRSEGREEVHEPAPDDGA